MDESLEFPDELISPEVWDQLEDEAKGFAGDARAEGFENIASHRDGSFATPSRFHVHSGGPVFNGLLQSRAMIRVVRELTGLPRLIPVRCAYNYYSDGDFMGIHRDSIKATLTITFSLTPGLPGMGWAPQLRKSPNKTLHELAAAKGIFPEGFHTMPVPYRGLRGFNGYNIPHWRVEYKGNMGILGNMCYFDL
jgi:hypothetical protein